MDGTGPSALADLTALARDFAGRAGAHDRDNSFSFENFERLSQAGLLNLTVPQRYGGQGRGLAEVCTVVGKIAEGDPSTALVLAMHYTHHAAIARSESWPEHLRGRVARDAVSGVALVNALRVEPELGTPARGGLPATTAEEVPEGWRISGHKIYSTGIPALRWLLVWARTAGEAPLVGLWLVPRSSAGIRVVETWDQLGMRATGSHDVILENVIVPREHAVDLRPSAAWAERDPVQAAWSALSVAALYDGIARAAADWLRDYLERRIPSNLGAPLATLPRFQEAVGRIEGLLAANRRLVRGAAAETDAGEPPSPEESGLVKSTVTNNAVLAVEIALSLTGNPGMSRHHPLERHYRDVLSGRVHTPQDDSVFLAAGRAALGTAGKPQGVSS
jgi:alkylation response protein AidB-like acyl-CoA dehydrogenase